MTSIVKITRRGQITILRELRQKYGIEENDETMMEETEAGLLIRRIPKLHDMAGVDAEFGKVNEIKREVERTREEYVGHSIISGKLTDTLEENASYQFWNLRDHARGQSEPRLLETYISSCGLTFC